MLSNLQLTRLTEASQWDLGQLIKLNSKNMLLKMHKEFSSNFSKKTHQKSQKSHFLIWVTIIKRKLQPSTLSKFFNLMQELVNKKLIKHIESLPWNIILRTTLLSKLHKNSLMLLEPMKCWILNTKMLKKFHKSHSNLWMTLIIPLNQS